MTNTHSLTSILERFDSAVCTPIAVTAIPRCPGRSMSRLLKPNSQGIIEGLELSQTYYDEYTLLIGRPETEVYND